MSQPQRDERVDLDPLLEFSSEPDVAPLSPTQLREPVAASGVLPAAPSDATSPDNDAALRARIDQLEQALDRSVQEVASLRSEIATLVSVKGDIKPRLSTAATAVDKRALAAVAKTPIHSKSSSPHRGRTIGAVAGVVIGVATGMWIWTTMSREPLIPAAPIRTTVAQPIAVSPDPPIVETPAIVPVASVTTVHTPAPRETSRPVDAESNRPINYVGTLSIDSDPAGEVFIDRKPAGRTPVLAKNLKAGSHLVWIERDGYRRFTRVVEVPADRVSRVVADLESATQR